VDKLTPVAWLFGATLVSGLLMALARKSLRVPLAVIHKILALVCLFLLIRAVGRPGGIHEPPALPAVIAGFAAAFLVSFATGVIESIPRLRRDSLAQAAPRRSRHRRRRLCRRRPFHRPRRPSMTATSSGRSHGWQDAGASGKLALADFALQIPIQWVMKYRAARPSVRKYTR